MGSLSHYKHMDQTLGEALLCRLRKHVCVLVDRKLCATGSESWLGNIYNMAPAKL